MPVGTQIGVALLISDLVVSEDDLSLFLSVANYNDEAIFLEMVNADPPGPRCEFFMVDNLGQEFWRFSTSGITLGEQSPHLQRIRLASHGYYTFECLIAGFRSNILDGRTEFLLTGELLSRNLPFHGTLRVHPEP